VIKFAFAWRFTYNTKKSKITDSFITVHAIKGRCVAGGAERILSEPWVCTKISRIFTVNSSCGSSTGVEL
jgi:hypothetical protein